MPDNGVDANNGILLDGLDLFAWGTISLVIKSQKSPRRTGTDIRIVAETVKLFLVKSGRESLEDIFIDVFGVGHLGRSIHDTNGRSVLELDNVLAGNGLPAGLDERSRLNDRSRNGQGKSGSDD